MSTRLWRESITWATPFSAALTRSIPVSTIRAIPVRLRNPMLTEGDNASDGAMKSADTDPDVGDTPLSITGIGVVQLRMRPAVP